MNLSNLPPGVSASDCDPCDAFEEAYNLLAEADFDGEEAILAVKVGMAAVRAMRQQIAVERRLMEQQVRLEHAEEIEATIDAGIRAAELEMEGGVS